MSKETPRVAVVIPCYKVRKQVVDLISGIGPQVHHILLVDDACPEHSGEFAESEISDSRLQVITHKENQGVGGAVISGIRCALENEAEIIVKLDGDGQYDPALIPLLIGPIVEGTVDCTKGNRFFNLENLAEMPAGRVFGNAMLSFINKLVSGYWDIMDPTNGLIAIHANIVRQIPLEKLDKRYFFESDLLFRLGTVRAVICDIPLQAFYRDETSSLSIVDVILTFPKKHLNRMFKRLFYNYFLRDFNMGSVSLVAAIILITSGAAYGMVKWRLSYTTGIPATAGMVMISGLQLLAGLNFLISFINYDIGNIPRQVQSRLLRHSGVE
ncbi:glycosyltransferase family 2 protein [bacterium]|nr:glycosyltransferase family 2 protein [bacterium]